MLLMIVKMKSTFAGVESLSSSGGEGGGGGGTPYTAVVYSETS